MERLRRPGSRGGRSRTGARATGIAAEVCASGPLTAFSDLGARWLGRACDQVASFASLPEQIGRDYARARLRSKRDNLAKPLRVT